MQRQEVSTFDMFFTINKHKWMLVACMVLVFCSFFLYIKYYALPYSSSVSFIVTESPLLETSIGNSAPTDIATQSETLNRIQYLVISNDMLEHLINKFSLDKYYRIDPRAEFAHEKTLRIVMNCINVKRSPLGLISITFKDMHRYKAAEIANEICSWLDTLNKKVFINALRKRLDISKIMIADIGRDNRTESSNFDTLLIKMNYSFGQLNNRSANDGRLFEIQQQFLQNIFMLQNSTQDLIKTRKAYELALQMVSDRNLPNIIVISKALPDDTSNVWRVLFICSLIILVLFSIYVFVLYNIKQYKDYFVVFFKK